MSKAESIYRACIYCDSDFDAFGGDRVCQDCRRRSEGRDLEEIANEYNNAWKLARVFDWRMLEEITDVLNTGERKDLAQLLEIPPNGKIMRDLVKHGVDAMGVGWILLSYHMEAPESYEFCFNTLEALRGAWNSAESETRRVFLGSLESDCVTATPTPTGESILFARADDGPFFVGLSNEPKAELRRLNREWRPMEVEFVGLLPGTPESYDILRAVLRGHRLDECWYGEKAADLLRNILDASASGIFAGLKDGPRSNQAEATSRSRLRGANALGRVS